MKVISENSSASSVDASTDVNTGAETGSASRTKIRYTAISLFPEMFSAVSEHGVVGRAVKDGLIALDVINPREFATDRHRTVDDRPYGGGPGMLMKVAPLEQAIEVAKSEMPGKVIYLSPQGKRIDHNTVNELSQLPHLILLSGRYEGVDERLIEKHVDLELSLGDYVLSGGELAAMAVIDAVTRLVPGVLGHQESATQDSHVDGLLDHPHYTRPEVIDEMEVPPVLLSGNHQAISEWRLKQQLGRTWLRRPDLLQKRVLSEQERKLLDAFQAEYSLENKDLLD